MERFPRTGTAVSLGRRTPRKRVLVSLSCPVTLSTSVRSSSPFSNPGAHTHHLNQTNKDGVTGGPVAWVGLETRQRLRHAHVNMMS